MMNVELPQLSLTLEHQVWEAVVKKDSTALGELLADDYVEITIVKRARSGNLVVRIKR